MADTVPTGGILAAGAQPALAGADDVTKSIIKLNNELAAEAENINFVAAAGEPYFEVLLSEKRTYGWGYCEDLPIRFKEYEFVGFYKLNGKGQLAVRVEEIECDKAELWERFLPLRNLSWKPLLECPFDIQEKSLDLLAQSLPTDAPLISGRRASSCWHRAYSRGEKGGVGRNSSTGG
jgi:hypothetical protein